MVRAIRSFSTVITALALLCAVQALPPAAAAAGADDANFKNEEPTIHTDDSELAAVPDAPSRALFEGCSGS